MLESEGVLTPRAGSPLERTDANPFFIDKLGDANLPSCLDAVHWVSDGDYVQYRPFLSLDPTIRALAAKSPTFLLPPSPRLASAEGQQSSTTSLPSQRQLYLERAGPRRQMFFNPADTVAGIVTGGGNP